MTRKSARVGRGDEEVDDVGIPKFLDMETAPDQAKQKGRAMVRRKRRAKIDRAHWGGGKRRQAPSSDG